MEKNPKDKTNTSPQPESLEVPSTIIEPTFSKTQAHSTAVDPTEEDSPGSIAKKGPFKFLPAWANIYLLLFLILITSAGAAVFVTSKGQQDEKATKTTGQSSLTTQQLAELASNSTIIGDPKQTLNVQSNSVFEGQVLMRNDLNVAGELKVGRPLSIPTLKVGGESTLGQLQVNESLSVSGNTTLQGQLTVQKSLSVTGAASFTTLSVAQLNVGSLQFSGDLAISRHVAPSGSLPSKTNGPALGGGGTASVSGADTAGTVTINTGSSPSIGCFVTVNFAQKFNTTPRVVISPSNSSSAVLNYYTNRSAANFSLCTANAPSASTTYIFDYIAFD